MKTRVDKLRQRGAAINRFRREAQERWALASPFRQKLYCEARLRGASPEEAIKKSRGPLR